MPFARTNERDTQGCDARASGPIRHDTAWFPSPTRGAIRETPWSSHATCERPGRRRECHDLTGVPLRVLSGYLRRGRPALDTDDPGQQAFQAMLFDCLFSRDGEHPWDRHGGRTFPELPLYFSWIAPAATG